MNLHFKNRGVTLIELMIAVGIIGILGAIAYPSYTRTVMKSHRTDARAELLDFSQRLQRCLTANGKYNTDVGVCTVKDSLIAGDGVVTRGGLYNVKATNVTATKYTLTATPISTKGQAKDNECYELTYDSTGKKSAKNLSGSDVTANCW